MGGGQSNTDKQSFPDPAKATDLTDYARLLDLLRARCGDPSLRTLARTVGPLLHPPRVLSHSTIATVFQPGRRRLDQDLLYAIVRALTGDEPTVDRWREAYLRVYREAKTGGPPGVLQQLPAELATFTGREVELQALFEAARSREAAGAAPSGIIAIEGMAGVGKTQLALRAAHEFLRAGWFTDMQLYVNLRGFDPGHAPADAAEVLAAFLRQLGVPPQHVPTELDELAAMYRDRLYGKQALVLLDNAVSADQVRPLIPAGPGCIVLITSRHAMLGLDGATSRLLDVFDDFECVELLSRIIGRERVRAEPEAVGAIIEACGKLPLAVRIAAARAASRPNWSLQNVARRLVDTSSRLDRLAVGDLAVRASLTLSFGQLSAPAEDTPGAAGALRRLGLWTGEDIAIPAAAALLGVDPATAETLLEELVDAHMLQTASVGRYHFHDLVRLFAAELAADLPEDDRAAALTGIVAWYAQATAEVAGNVGRGHVHAMPERLSPTVPPPVFSSSNSAMSWCDTERVNLLAAIGLAVRCELLDVAWRMPVNLFGYFSAGHLIADWTAALESVTVVLDEVELPGQAALLKGLAAVSSIAGRFTQAAEFAARAATLFRALGDRQGEGAAVNNQGSAIARGGDPSGAIAYFQRAVDIFEGIGLTMGVAVQYTNIGAAYTQVDRFDEAARWFESCITLCREHEYRYTEGKALANLAEVEYRRGNLAAARTRAEAALEVTEETGNRQDKASALGILGLVLEQDGDLERAVSLWKLSTAILDEIGEPQTAEIARRLEEVGVPAESGGW